MRYALTVSDDVDSWEATNTLMVEAPSKDDILEHLPDILRNTLEYTEREIKHVLECKLYYIYSCDDVDYVIESNNKGE